MKRILLSILMSIGMILSAVACAHSTQAATLGPAIFLTPHQDDESLTMGAAIKQHVLAGREVIVILLTDGGASGVCKTMFGTTEQDRADCVAERDREFTDAVTAQGATPVIPEDRMVDGTLTGAYTAEVIRKYALMYPNASFKTLSEYDSLHPDHRAAGRGLYAAYLWGYTGDARWYVRREDQGVHTGSCTPQYVIDNVLQAYYPRPGEPQSGIGYISVGTEFQWANNGDGVHGPAAYSKAFTPAQRGANGGTYTKCYPGS
jgi:LmbE family N-acetylglucosaminyl deacetylase